MSVLLIQMSNFSFYIVSLFRLRYSETRVVGLINIVIIVIYFDWGQHIALTFWYVVFFT